MTEPIKTESIATEESPTIVFGKAARDMFERAYESLSEDDRERLDVMFVQGTVIGYGVETYMHFATQSPVVLLRLLLSNGQNPIFEAYAQQQRGPAH